MPPDQIIAFFVFAAAAAVTPGPSNVMVMAAGARAGVAGGLPCLAGVVAGMAVMMGAAGLGLGGVVQAFPAALSLLKWGGALFLLWLAWKIARAPALHEAERGEPIGFWKALAFQWVNPKSWIVSVSAASTFDVAAGAGLVERAVTLGSVFASAATPSCLVWLVFGASVKRWLVDDRRARRFNIAMGAALAASVLLVLR